MKQIKRDPIKFDVFSALVQFSHVERLSLRDSKTADSFMNRIRSSIDSSVSNDAFVYGQRTQAMFEALVLSLGRVKLLKQEDSGDAYSTDEGIRIPDERLILFDGRRMLVEVKNYYQQSDPFGEMEFEEEYIDGLVKYATLMNCELLLATYWARWNHWSLVPLSILRREKEKAKLSHKDAMMFNEMASLGDLMVGTKVPLALTIITDKEKPRTLSDDEEASFYIADMKISCAGQVLVSSMERNIAWYLMMHGDWEEQEPTVKVSGDQVDELSFEWLPQRYHDDREEHDARGFAFIGTLSGMFSKYYKSITNKDGCIGTLRVDITPGFLGQMIPDEYKGEALPLWRIVQRPKQVENLQ